MGRNNDSLISVKLDSTPGKFIKSNQQIMDAWFEVWLTVHVPKLVYQPKWF